MAANSFGNLFKMTTWGESHGPSIGVVIDGCPAGIPLTLDMIQYELAKRAPGQSHLTSPRKETDQAEILSGTFENLTTGAPIAISIRNCDSKPEHYEPIKDLLRPGHANFTHLNKYGRFDHRGGGRASARETACRVAAGAVAKALLAQESIRVLAYVQQIGTIIANPSKIDCEAIAKSPLFCPDEEAEHKMIELIVKTKEEGDSLGGAIAFCIEGVPIGLGDPVYEKLEANLAKAMLSIPASKGFEIGSGFQAIIMKGSEHNDLFIDNHSMKSNHSGGTLGGISTGQIIYGRVAFKPTSSIKKEQKTCTIEGKPATLKLPENSRHDPCVAIRAVPVVEAMAALVIADALLLNRSAQI